MTGVQTCALPIYPAVSVILLGGDSLICYNTSPGQLTANASGGNSAYIYSWYKNNIASGISSQTYTPFNLTDTTVQIYCTVSSMNCPPISSNTINIHVLQSKTLQLKLFLEGLYNNNSMVETMNGNLDAPQWGPNIADKMGVELHEENPPYNTFYSLDSVNLSTNGIALMNTPCAMNGNYYIAVKTRNHIYTWSSISIPFNSNLVSYDFTTSMLQAYGIDAQLNEGNNNYAFCLGDLDQNGWVDSEDYNLFEPDLSMGLVGCFLSDFNGSGWVDSEDFNMFETHLSIGNISQSPIMFKK